ncbi:conserved membrane hypothetical protein [Candidatus Roizmanbacteria bacterium]|nr:conserved membrane hypothetical protein [Candidatus Roizmanbacteria bacterium]
MDFKKILVNILSSFLIVINRFIGLIFNPYKTMRHISEEKDIYQPTLIITVIFIYFKFIYYLRDKIYPATFVYILFIINFLLTVAFFYLLSKLFTKNKKEIKLSSFIFTFVYSLFPTLIWFLSTSILYIFLPPPRTFSLMGKGFSIFFIAYSLSLLIWKLILVYLAVRFSLKQNFFRIIFMLIFYLIWFIPYSIFLYQFKLFRIPFI